MSEASERVETAVEKLTTVVTDFRIDTASALSRIEAHSSLQGNALTSLEDRVSEVEVDALVATKTASKLGRRWGAALGVSVIALAETVKAWLG